MTQDHSSTIGVFDTHGQAEAAVRELKKGGFSLDKVSIVAKGLQKELSQNNYNIS